MNKSFLINKYLFKEFFKTIGNMCLLFFALGCVINLFEEINFFKDLNVAIYLPIMMTVLYVPSIFYNIFPFIVLFSGIWFFLKIKKNDELTAMRISGISTLSIITIPAILSIILGIFIITSLNPVTSALVKKYERIKGAYEKEFDYLAAITGNGIWIKEKSLDKNTIIRSSNLQNQNLMKVTIYEFDDNSNILNRIEAESANISSYNWKLKNVKIIDNEGKVISSNLENFSYLSTYDLEKIKSLYTNLDTVSFWNIDSQIKLLEKRGYSTKAMEAKLHRSLAYPFFLLSMVLLAGVFTLGMNFKENNLTYIIVAIILSVIIYFFNDFSSVLGKTEKLPIVISAWMPIVIIFIFGSIGVIHANQK